MLNFFKRDWVLIDTQILPSAYEQLKAGNQILKHVDNADSFFQKCLVQTFKCQITGKIKTVRTYN